MSKTTTLVLSSARQTKKFQEVTCTLLYYARVVNSTILPALGSVSTQEADPTKHTMAKVSQFLDHASTHLDTIITYHASNMVLVGHSDESYLSESKARSRAGGFFSCLAILPLHQTMDPL